jgi:hypothetical protein
MDGWINEHTLIPPLTSCKAKTTFRFQVFSTVWLVVVLIESKILAGKGDDEFISFGFEVYLEYPKKISY